MAIRGWLVILTISSVLASGDAHGAPTPVPTGHPRVYVRASDLPGIKAKLSMAEFTDSWNKVKASDKAVCRAFRYLVQGDTSAGQQAVSQTLAELKGCTDARTFDTCMHHGGIVYDWCYPLLTSSQKNAYITELKRIAGSHSPFYPAKPDTGAVVGHNTEGWLLTGQLPAGVAIYDEEPKMYDAAAKLFFDQFVPVRDFLYPAHMHHQGDSYIGARFQHDQAASWLLRRMGGGNVVSAEQQYVPYQLIYNLRPDGQQMRSGDTYDDQGKSSSKRRLMILTGSYYGDPYLLTMADFSWFWGAADIDHVLRLLLQPGGVQKKPISHLPLTKYFPPPMGEMVARTGWTHGVDSPDVVVQMRIGGTFFGNHQRKDFGTFQIYHRGPLAISSGVYEGSDCKYGSDHWTNYYHQTIAHNGLLIFDPAEKMHLHGKERANDGGQRWPNLGLDHPVDLATLKNKDYQLAAVTGHQVGPTTQKPEYSYIAGEITEAYAPAKVSQVTRSMVTLTTGDKTYPAIVVVFDRVTSTNASFKKTWLLHSIEKPTINGQKVTIVRSGPTYDDKGAYDGKLVTESLLPKQAVLTVVGGSGKEFWVEDSKKNYACTKGGAAEPGAWRMEVSPATPAATDRFLHVLTTMKGSTAAGPATTLIEGSSHVGAAVLDRAVLFARDGTTLDQADFKLPGGSTLEVLVCDLKPGSYIVTHDGAPLGHRVASKEGTCIYFQGGAGSYAVAPGAPSDSSVGHEGGAWDASSTDTGNTGADAGAGGDQTGKRGADGCSCRVAPPLDETGATLLVALVALVALLRRRVTVHR